VWKEDSWNDVVVSAQGRDLRVWVNGLLTATLLDDTGRTSGHFGLQLHGGQAMHVEIQSVDLLEAVATETAPEFAEVGSLAPNFTLTDLDGEAHTLADLRGKIVVLEWFNPGCPVVKRAHTTGPLAGMGNELMNDGVVWLAINSGAPGKQGHGAVANKKAAAQWKLRYPVLIDEEGAVGRSYRALTTPHMFVINPTGHLVYDGAIDNSPSGRLSSEHQNFVAMALECIASGEEVDFGATPYGCSVKYASGGGRRRRK
jgi:peroxiredoxin